MYLWNVDHYFWNLWSHHYLGYNLREGLLVINFNVDFVLAQTATDCVLFTVRWVASVKMAVCDVARIYYCLLPCIVARLAEVSCSETVPKGWLAAILAFILDILAPMDLTDSLTRALAHIEAPAALEILR